MDRTLPAGASGALAAARNGRLVHCEGFGLADRRRRVRARCGTVFDIGSVTKQFTGAAILKLQMLGRLRVTDRLSTYVSGVPGDKREITIHHLLTHTSGLVDGLGGDYEPLSREAMLQGALASELQSAPGERYAYSNLGYSVLGAIIERVSGMGYERFLRKYLFRPAGMRSTGYVLPQFKRRRVAVEYGRTGASHGRPYEHPWAVDGPYWNLRANGGLLSSARDMFRWHRALRGSKVLSRRAKRALFSRHVREDGPTYYGYGWSIFRYDGHWAATHNGGNGLSYARFALLPGERMVFWVTNRAFNRGTWNLERADSKLTLGVVERLARAG